VVSGPWRVVTVAGVGLIGGSFALALRQAGFSGKIIGVSSPATIAAALSLGVIDEALPLAEAAAVSDAIYLAQPIEAILKTLGEVDPYVRPGTLITDAGSTKRAIVERAAATIHRGRFIGGHPMAGKETRGVEEAEAGLFRGRPYVLTGGDAELESWIEKIGGRLVQLEAGEHDSLVALVSHLPQLLSTALASLIAERPDAAAAARVAGPAARDMTRLALSPYDIWRDILATNPEEIDRVLAAMMARLEQLRAQLPLAGRAPSHALQETFTLGAIGAATLRQS
jgi:prephenate dehydrogenase